LDKLLEELEDSYKGLTDSQKKVARYIINNYEQVAFCTLDDLANRIGVSTTTIIRFSRNLGYAGYSDLLSEIRKIIKARITLPERLCKSVKEVKRDQLLLDSFNLDMNNIKSTLESLEYTKLVKAVETITRSRVVYVVGIRSSFALAHFFATALGQIRDNVRLLHLIGTFFPEEDVVSAAKQDVGVIFSFPRYTKLTINIAHSLKEQGAKIIGITDSLLSPITEISDIVLPCNVDTMLFKNSLVAPLSLINYLINSVAMADEEKAVRILSKNEELCRKYGYFRI
jgi:DNA-binding MurR/RpiR family transcriptional regulator